MRNFSQLFLVILFCSVGFGQARADMGPKPTIDITLSSELIDIITGGTLLLCEENDCSEAKPLQNFGPQEFACVMKEADKDAGNSFVKKHIDIGHCGGLAYGFAPFLQLKLTLKDGDSLFSNVFEKKAFKANFKAYFEEDLLTVTEE